MTVCTRESHIAVQQQYPDVDNDITDVFNIKAKAKTVNNRGLSNIQAMAQVLQDTFHFHCSM